VCVCVCVYIYRDYPRFTLRCSLQVDAVLGYDRRVNPKYSYRQGQPEITNISSWGELVLRVGVHPVGLAREHLGLG